MYSIGFKQGRIGTRALLLTIGLLTVSGLLLSLSSVRSAPQGGPNIVGQWSQVYPWPPQTRAVHAHMLPTGKVLVWPYGDTPHLWEPPPITAPPENPGTFTEAPLAGYNIFCSGHSFMADGKLFVAGGGIGDPLMGISNASIYDPFAGATGSWNSVAIMNEGRWYPTNTTLANGDVLVTAGDSHPEEPVVNNPLPQVWPVVPPPTGDMWRSLYNAIRNVPFYPRMHLAPNGYVFNSGGEPNTKYLDPNYVDPTTQLFGRWIPVDDTEYGNREYLLTSVLYDDGKVMIAGGGPVMGSPPTDTSEVICLHSPPVTCPTGWQNTWRYTRINGQIGGQQTRMAFPRKQHNATLLPDGKVLVTGGTNGSERDNPNFPVLAAEMWDPVTEQWTTLASAPIYRGYHSTALLLPDGRVLSAGGDHDPPVLPISNASAEIYSPPYLFAPGGGLAVRPTINLAPPMTVTYGQPFSVGVGTTGALGTSITNVNWIRLSSVTHSINMDQRINRLTFTQNGNTLNITAPSNPNLCPPGYYMLFILNNLGVPSEAKFIKIN